MSNNNLRNAPCPCGSGKRYKHCCGNSAVTTHAGSHLPLLYRALAEQQQGHSETAASLYQEVLNIDPHEPDAHNMLGVIRSAQGLHAQALQHAYQAAHLTAWGNSNIIHNFTCIYRSAIGGGVIAEFCTDRRSVYADWLNREAYSYSAPVAPVVSIILIWSGRHEEDLSSIIEALIRQTYAALEIILVTEHTISDDIFAIPRERPGITLRTASCNDLSPAVRLNHGIAQATGKFINPLLCPDSLPENRIAAMVACIPEGGWGFARVKNLTSTSETGARTKPLSLLDPLEANTCGFALLQDGDIVVSASNLFFSRELWRRLGGFDARAADPLRDFCLRALWLMEPVLLDEVGLLQEALTPRSLGTDKPADTLQQQGALPAFYRRAVGDEPPPNPFAPSYKNWGLVMIDHVIRRNHAMHVPHQAWEFLIAESIRQIEIFDSRPIEPVPGINLVGPVNAGFGLAENMRAFATACLSARIPCTICEPDLNLNAKQGNGALKAPIALRGRHRHSVFFMNPDIRYLYERSLDAAVFHCPVNNFSHYKIGFWFWELEKIPDQWRYALDHIDEIWVATEFVATAFRKITDKPVIKILTPIDFSLARHYTRADFDLPESPFLFLFSFDFHSFPHRKNPEGAIRAFKIAFPHSEKAVGLVIKSINGEIFPDKLKALQAEIDGDERIVILDEFMSRDKTYGLMSITDAYLSLHRCEGLGLGMAESMHLGKPVIATAYSGNLEFMSAENSCLVDYRLTPIKPGEYLYDDAEFVWAEPSTEHAALFMRRLVSDQDFRLRIAKRGQQDVQQAMSLARAAALVRQRLDQLGALI